MATFYETYATDYMVIDMDEQGLFCSVPSEQDINVKYTVRCDEQKDSVEVVNCNCPGHRRWGHCKHADICQAYWTRMYRSNQEKLAKQAAEAAKHEAELAVKEAEKIVTPQYTNRFTRPWNKITESIEAEQNRREILAQAREIRERRQKMDYQSARTLDFFSNLPSRKELASTR